MWVFSLTEKELHRMVVRGVVDQALALVLGGVPAGRKSVSYDILANSYMVISKIICADRVFKMLY